MIPLLLFITLLFIDAIMVGVIVFAHDNEMYLDILAALGASALSWYLSLCMLKGCVSESSLVESVVITIVNRTVTTHEVSYGILLTPILDPILSGFLCCCACILTIITFGLVLEAGLEILTQEE